MQLNENYFQTNKDDSSPKSVEESLFEGETVFWRGKPQKKAFVLNNVLKMFPIALIWIVFDSFFIYMAATNFEMIPLPAIIFMCVFFVFHLMPVWIWVYRCVTVVKRHKNTEYAFTDRRIIICKGAIATDIKNIDYNDVIAVNLRYGIIDRITKVGDIYITAKGKAIVLEDLENPVSVEKTLQQIVASKKPNVPFTDNAKVTYVKCKYCGTKNKSTDSTCSSCGAPLD